VDGVFRVEAVRPGTYQVRVSFIGYETLRRDGVVVRAGQETALGVVRLTPSTATLGEAEVTAQRELIEQRADRTVYNVQEQAVTAGGSALETLQTLPSIEVDTDGNLSLRGNQNVVVQINGRPVPVRGAFLASLLRQIPANRVDRVEVIPNPSARYDADGMSGIINIVLLEGTDRGLSGGLTFGGGTQPNGEIGANVSYQKGAWDLYSSYGFRYDDFALLGDSERLTFALNGTPDLDLTVNQIIDEGRNTASHFWTGSATYTLNPSTTVAFEGSAGLRGGGSRNEITSSVLPTGGAVSQSLRLTDGDRAGLNGDAALVLRRQFGRQTSARTGGAPASGGGGGGGMMMGGFGGTRGGGGTQGSHELAVEVRGTRNASDDQDAFTQRLLSGSEPDELTRTQNDQVNDEANLQVDYTRPLGAMRLETGFKGTLRRVDSDLLYEINGAGGYVEDPTRTNAFVYDEGVYAAYVQGARGFGSFDVQAGLRAEAANRDFTLATALPSLPPELGVDLTATSLSYQSLFPSAFVSYNIEPGTLLKASYSRRIERPRTFFLNPFPTFEDTTSIRVGNPGLRPEYTSSYELTAQYKYFLNVTPFYRHTTDVIRRRFFFNPETGVSTFTSTNLDTQDSYGADVSLFGQFLGGGLRGFLSGSVARTVTDGTTTDGSTGIGSDAMQYSARGSVQVKVRQGTDVQFFGFYRAPLDVEDGRISGFGFTTLGVNQKISDALSLSARVNDLFKTARFEYLTEQDGQFRLIGVRRPQIQQISATLTWTFGAGTQRRQTQQQPEAGGDGFGF
jgi:outer membrane receptor protein involved in Fe transport